MFQGEVPEEASDARFNVPVHGEHIGNDHQAGPELFTHRPERGRNMVYVDPSMTTTAWSGQGLVWRFSPGQEIPDIGRCFSSPNALEDFHSVDLRTILAHLDSAAQAVKSELDERYRNGGR